MQFLVADTFVASLARLTPDEQEAVRTAASELKRDPSTPGLNWEPIHLENAQRFYGV